MGKRDDVFLNGFERAFADKVTFEYCGFRITARSLDVPYCNPEGPGWKTYVEVTIAEVQGWKRGYSPNLSIRQIGGLVRRYLKNRHPGFRSAEAAHLAELRSGTGQHGDPLPVG